MAAAFSLYVTVGFVVLGMGLPVALIVTAVTTLVAAGVHSLAPRLLLARALAATLLFPPLLGALMTHSPAGLLLASMLVVYLAYSVLLARKLNDEYWVGSRTTAKLAQAMGKLGAIQGKMLEQEKLAGLGLLAAGIAHEINNPMAIVTVNVEMLLEDLQRRPDVARELPGYVDDIVPATLDGIARVNTIVADLSRFAQGDREGAVECDLNLEVAAAVRIAAVSSKYGSSVVLELGDVPGLSGHPQQIVQLVVNLVVNAAQASGAHGTVVVRTWSERDVIGLSVADDGVGMTPQTRGRVFDPFFTTKPVGEGTGLRLAVVHGIVKAHGGTIEVESEPGRGSCFSRARLPRGLAPELRHSGGGSRGASFQRVRGTHARHLASVSGAVGGRRPSRAQTSWK